MLFRGVDNKLVVEVKRKLQLQGFWPQGVSLGSMYGPKTFQAVMYFQQTHLGPDGLPLEIDGFVGPDTQWALNHPTGKAQKSGLGPVSGEDRYRDIPHGIGPARDKLLRIALDQYGIRERPNGSNRGTTPRGGVDKFLPAWCCKKEGKGPAWCCFFVSWVTKEAFGVYPLGRRYGSCKQAWAAANERRMLREEQEGILALRRRSIPIPGDAFYMRYGRGTGHIGFVYRVSQDGREINTIEGNCANRVKIGYRCIDYRIFGFINFYGEQWKDFSAGILSSFERGLLEAPDVSRAGTR